MEKWKQQVKVRGEHAVEGVLDDGYSWRKYGQKDILGANHPRSYYRCTYRQIQGCFATKQIQRSGEDSNVFDITYRGRHTCNPFLVGSSSLTTPPSPFLSPPPPPETHQSLQQNQIFQSSEILLNFQTSVKDVAENLDTFSFLFPSTCNNNFIFPALDNNFQSNVSPSIVSSATSRSTDFSNSSPRMSWFGGDPSAPVVETELNELVSVVTSSINSPTFGMQHSSNFSFDNSRFHE